MQWRYVLRKNNCWWYRTFPVHWVFHYGAVLRVTKYVARTNGRQLDGTTQRISTTYVLRTLSSEHIPYVSRKQSNDSAHTIIRSVFGQKCETKKKDFGWMMTAIRGGNKLCFYFSSTLSLLVLEKLPSCNMVVLCSPFWLWWWSSGNSLGNGSKSPWHWCRFSL